MNERKLHKLAAVLQDAYHYFDSVSGGGTFSYKGLKGKIDLYESGRNALNEAIELAIAALGGEYLPHAYMLVPESAEDITSEKQLEKEAKQGRRKVEELARHFHIDAYAGEVRP